MKGISNSEARRCIIVCSPRKTCIRKVLRQLKGRDFRWVYLGEDTSLAIAIEQQLRDKGQRIEIGGKLQEIAWSLRQPYIDYIGKLSLENNSLLWWVGSLSEKNPWVSKTFLYTCYVKLCQATLNSSGQETLLFIGENRALRECLAANIADIGKWNIVCLESPINRITGTLRRSMRMILYKAYFVAETTYRLLLARRYGLKQAVKRKLQEGKGLVLLHNWVDPRSFDADGNYRDIFLGGLAHHLRNKGKSVVIVPYILHTVPYRQTLKKLAQSLDCVLVPESFLTISDVLSVFMKTMLNIPARKVYPAFEGIDITGIIMSDLSRDWAGTHATSTLLLYKAIKRWKNAGVSIDTFIYPFENQVWEKAYCLALRKYYPAAKIIGHQHSHAPKMLLTYFFARDELPILPFPDKVITTGKYTEKLFKESGYDPARVVCGGATRYAGMLKPGGPAPAKRDSSRPVILVTPPTDKNESLELIWKVLAALGQVDRYKVILKLHPDAPYSGIARAIGPLPANFAVSNQPVSALLEESHMLIYTSSTTSIEALSRGVPVLHIESDLRIDWDVLADFSPAVRQSARTKDDISRMTENILKTEERELLQQRALWDNIVNDMFGPVDESVLDLFL
jgi:hypothetical protein